MSITDPQGVVDFSLAGGGLLSRLMRRLGLADRVLALAIIFSAVAWIPLLILSVMDGLAVGNAVRISFLQDYGAYGRLLVAVPLLLIAEIPIGRRTRDVLREFVTARLVREQDIPLFDSAVRDATRRKDSVLLEVVILGIIYAAAGIRSNTALSDPLTTWYRAGGSITLAGWYYAFVSLPMLQFLLIRWVWRLAIWTGLLWRISRLDLQLLPIHPDRTGGLGFLGLAQIPFGLVGFAVGSVISSHLINDIAYRGVSLGASTGTMAVYVILAVLILIAPILVFTYKLVDLRANGILKYEDIGEDYATLFENKWIGGFHPEDETILGSSDIQSLADLANSFNIVQDMKITPADRPTITVLAITAAIPMIPVFFVALPFDEIIARIIGILG